MSDWLFTVADSQEPDHASFALDEQFTEDVETLDADLPSASVPLVYLVLYVEDFFIASFSLPFSMLSLLYWPLTWKTIILQCSYTVGWVT